MKTKIIVLNSFINKKVIILFIVAVLLIIPGGFVDAQTSRDFLISWEADSYAPSWYQGKVFPSQGSRITIKFELVENGKIANLSKTKVRWYINNKLVRNETSGLGIKSYTFFNNVSFSNNIDVRIAIIEYKGINLEEAFSISVKPVEAVIEIPSFNRQIEKGKFLIKAWPFFFNIRDLGEVGFSWLINGKAQENEKIGGEFDLEIKNDVSAREKINLGVRIDNLKNTVERASRTILLEVK